MAEQAVAAISADTAMPAVTIRPPLVYGPGNGGNMLRLLKLIERNLPLPFASIRNHRSLIYVDNLASAIIACALHPAPISPLYVVRDGRDLSTAELITELCWRFEPPRRRPWPFPESLLRAMSSLAGLRRPSEALLSSLQLRDDLIRSQLSWSPTVPVEVGLAKTVKCFQDREHGPRRSASNAPL